MLFARGSWLFMIVAFLCGVVYGWFHLDCDLTFWFSFDCVYCLLCMYGRLISRCGLVI